MSALRMELSSPSLAASLLLSAKAMAAQPEQPRSFRACVWAALGSFLQGAWNFQLQTQLQ